MRGFAVPYKLEKSINILTISQRLEIAVDRTMARWLSSALQRLITLIHGNVFRVRNQVRPEIVTGSQDSI